MRCLPSCFRARYAKSFMLSSAIFGRVKVQVVNLASTWNYGNNFAVPSKIFGIQVLCIPQQNTHHQTSMENCLNPHSSNVIVNHYKISMPQHQSNKRNTSFFWKGLMKLDDLFVKGLCHSIGRGLDIWMWGGSLDTRWTKLSSKALCHYVSGPGHLMGCISCLNQNL